MPTIPKIPRLVHGDCRHILPTLAPESIHLILTDPPYGCNANNGDLISRREELFGGQRKPNSLRHRPITNDDEEADIIFREILEEFNRVLVPGGVLCCCGGGGGYSPQPARWTLWIAEVFDFQNMVVWDKAPMGMGKYYRSSYEVVLVAKKKGASLRWFDTSKRVENIIRPGGKIRKILPSELDHPTPKPRELAEHFIKLHTQPGEVILDPFMGHGWVGQAAKRLGRWFVGVEIDQQFFQEAQRQIQETQSYEFLSSPSGYNVYQEQQNSRIGGELNEP